MEKLKKSALIGVNIAVYLALAYIVLKYALAIVLPFAITFIIVVISRPLIDKISKHTKIPKSAVSLFVIGGILVLLIYLIILASGAILDQIGSIISIISEHLSQENNYITTTISFFESFINKFPFLKNEIFDNTSLQSVALDMATNMVATISEEITRAIGAFISSMPEIIITIIVMLLSLFYFSKDYVKITQKINKHLPEKIKKRLPRVKRDVVFVLSSYLRSYLMLLFITFAEIFAGLLILGVDNALVISIIVSLVDLLPILGVGTVLIPWAVFAFILGNSKLAIGLIILFGVVYLIRQIIEPKIVSSQMNVHPLIAIFSLYAGLKIAGLGGMIVAPLLAFMAKTIYEGLKKEKSIEKEEKLC